MERLPATPALMRFAVVTFLPVGLRRKIPAPRPPLRRCLQSLSALISQTFGFIFALCSITSMFFMHESLDLACYFQVGKRSCAPLARPQQFLSWPGYVACLVVRFANSLKSARFVKVIVCNDFIGCVGSVNCPSEA